jgi:anti-anti-sigma factor
LCQAVTDLVRPGLRSLTVDLEALTFVDVAGMRAFCHAREMAATVGAAFCLSSVRDQTRRVIRVAQFEDLEDTIIEPASGASAA